MKKGIYIHYMTYESQEDLDKSGVYKKVAAQRRALEQCGPVDYGLYNRFGMHKTVLSNLARMLPWTPTYYNWKYSSKYDGYDYIYFRRDSLDSSVIRFLSKIKKNNPKTKIIMEIPTYPYDGERTDWRKTILYMKDRNARKKVKTCVDRIVTMSVDKEIFGVPTIHIFNGIDIDRFPVRVVKESPNIIILMAVASMTNSHGFDRVIEGLKNYYSSDPEKKVVFWLVGNGGAVKTYKELVDKYNLGDYVVFYGFRSGKALEELYDQASLGVGALAMHRSNLYLDSTLKSREYLAKGLPFIHSTKIDVIPPSYPYVYRVSENDDAIDINEVVNFYNKITENESSQKIADKIHQYAAENCDIKMTMQPVINYILSEGDQ